VDVDSLQTTRDPTAFVAMQKQLALSALGDQPPAWSQFWFGSHPTTLERIAIAEQLARRMGVPTAGEPRAETAMAADPWVRGHPCR
jgi:predicted Zn-dependent protease